MNIRIRIPPLLVQAWDWFGDWGDVPVLRYEHSSWDGSKYTKPRLELRRIDLVIAALFLFCIGFYGVFYGVRGALGGGLSFIVVAALALFCRR